MEMDGRPLAQSVPEDRTDGNIMRLESGGGGYFSFRNTIRVQETL